MALQALKSAVDLFSNPELSPELPSWGNEIDEILEKAKSAVEKISTLALSRKAASIIEKQRVNDEFKTLAEQSPERLGEAVKNLDDVIDTFSGIIERSNARIDAGRTDLDRSLADLASKSVGLAKPTRRIMNDLFVALTKYHNQIVEFYYFLLALRAEYSVDSRDGPSFNDPVALGDYLREQMKV